MIERDAAWLAGYIDGDGCVSICRRERNSTYRQPELVIDSCDRELLDHVKELVGGYITPKSNRSSVGRQGWHWQVRGGKKVIPILEQVAPYLHCNDKKNRAELLISDWKICTPKNGFYTEETSKAKLELERKILSIGSSRKSRFRIDVKTAGLA
jgi:hypothetical protein